MTGPLQIVPPAEAWWKASLMVTFAFRCNAACTFCMVEDALNFYPGTSLDELRAVAADPARVVGVERIILSGGEVTLARELLDYVRVARSIPSVKHVRVQTNAIELGRGSLLAELLDVGVDELFVSLHASDEASCDAITRRPGSFREILAGLEAIARSSASLTTNTAIVAANHTQLRSIVELAATFGPRSVELWSYWPRGDEHGTRGELVRVGDVRPHLFAALEAATARGISPVVKWYPRCLLGPWAAYHDNGQPPSLVDDRYWAREPHYACLYEGVCEEAGARCSGLPFPYVERFGWEDQLLVPRRGVAPVGPNGESVLSRSLVKEGAHRADAAVAAAWLAPFGLTLGASLCGYSLVKTALGRGARMVALAFEREGRGVHVQVHPRGQTAACFATTPSFEVLYSRARGTRLSDVEELVREVVARLAAHDPGGLDVPGKVHS